MFWISHQSQSLLLTMLNYFKILSNVKGRLEIFILNWESWIFFKVWGKKHDKSDTHTQTLYIFTLIYIYKISTSSFCRQWGWPQGGGVLLITIFLALVEENEDMAKTPGLLPTETRMQGWSRQWAPWVPPACGGRRTSLLSCLLSPAVWGRAAPKVCAGRFCTLTFHIKMAF